MNKVISNEETIVVYAPDFLKNISDIVTAKLNSSEGRLVINNYLVWHTVKALTCCVSKAFRDAEKILRKAILGSDGKL